VNEQTNAPIPFVKPEQRTPPAVQETEYAETAAKPKPETVTTDPTFAEFGETDNEGTTENEDVRTNVPSVTWTRWSPPGVDGTTKVHERFPFDCVVPEQSVVEAFQSTANGSPASNPSPTTSTEEFTVPLVSERELDGMTTNATVKGDPPSLAVSS
jgi:hypothetical protein